jgi:hypothetical protein
VQHTVTFLVLQVPPTTGNQCCSCCARFPLLQQQVPRKQSTSRQLDQVIDSMLCLQWFHFAAHQDCTLHAHHAGGC